MEKLIPQLEKARELYRKLETTGSRLEDLPAKEWSLEKLRDFQEYRRQLFAALEDVNKSIRTIQQDFPPATEMPAELQALIREQLELIERIQQQDRRLLAHSQALTQQLEPLLKSINTRRNLTREYHQPEDKNPPPPRFFKATI